MTQSLSAFLTRFPARSPRRRSRALVWASAIAAVSAVACGGSSESATPSTVPAAPGEPLAFVSADTTPSPLLPLTDLTRSETCGLADPADVTAATGLTLELPPIYRNEDGLGVSCAYYDVETFELAAKVEIGVLPYSTVQQIWVFDDEDPTTESIGYRECRIAGLPSICAEPYDLDGLQFGATVLVQIGGPDDPALLVEATTPDAARELATNAVGELDL